MFILFYRYTIFSYFIQLKNSNKIIAKMLINRNIENNCRNKADTYDEMGFWHTYYYISMLWNL